MKKMKTIILICMLLLAGLVKSQINPNDYKVSAEKEKQFQPYVQSNLHIYTDFEVWKNNNKILYRQELWYFAESFYIKRGNSDNGSSLDASMIDIARFESYRKENEESIVTIPGVRDAIVLIPENKLIYKHK